MKYKHQIDVFKKNKDEQSFFKAKIKNFSKNTIQENLLLSPMMKKQLD